MLNIYDFDSPHRYLQAYWQEKKRDRSAFSMRAWAKKFGFRNNSTLSFLLKGSRPFSKKHLGKFVEVLGLLETEAEYFEALVDRSLQNSIDARKYYDRKIEKLRRMGMNHAKSYVDTRMLLSSPLYLMIFDMVELAGFQNSVEWIQSQMLHPITRKEISDALSKLKRLGFLKEQPDGTLKKTCDNLFFPHDVPMDDPSRDYQFNAIELTKASVGKFSPENSKFVGYSFRVKLENIPKINRLLEACIDEVLTRFEAAPGEGEAMHQLNVYAFPLTQNTNYRRSSRRST